MTMTTEIYFTPREKRILALLAEGFTQREVADQLGYVRGSVGNALNYLFNRTGIRNAAQAIAVAARMGVI